MAGMTGGFVPTFGGLARRDGRLVVEGDGGDPKEVTVHYLRPLTSRREVVFLDKKGEEVASVASLDALPPKERRLAEEALQARYHLPVIQRVERVELRFGTRYWWVETDKGPRWFALREPGKNVTWITPTHVVLRDTVGNRLEIPDLYALDPKSRRWVGLSL